MNCGVLYRLWRIANVFHILYAESVSLLDSDVECMDIHIKFITSKDVVYLKNLTLFAKINMQKLRYEEDGSAMCMISVCRCRFIWTVPLQMKFQVSTWIFQNANNQKSNWVQSKFENKLMNQKWIDFFSNPIWLKSVKKIPYKLSGNQQHSSSSCVARYLGDNVHARLKLKYRLGERGYLFTVRGSNKRVEGRVKSIHCVYLQSSSTRRQRCKTKLLLLLTVM